MNSHCCLLQLYAKSYLIEETGFILLEMSSLKLISLDYYSSKVREK